MFHQTNHITVLPHYHFFHQIHGVVKDFVDKIILKQAELQYVQSERLKSAGNQSSVGPQMLRQLQQIDLLKGSKETKSLQKYPLTSVFDIHPKTYHVFPHRVK